MRYILSVLLLAAQVPLWPQVGYPGSGPPGQQPGEPPGPGIPWPHHRKKDADPKNPTKSVAGKLTKLDEQAIVVEASDGRVLTFKRTDKTKFLREQKEIKPADLKPGNNVTVQATEDNEGFLYAVNVYLEAAAPAEEEASAPPTENGGRASGNTTTPTEDSGAPGPPRLKRGIPVDNSDADEDTPAPVTAAAAKRETAEAAPDADPVIEKARQATATFTEKLPNYVCKEYMTRYASMRDPADWKPLDVVSTDLVYENGREKYRDVSVNGKPTHKGLEETGGAWSTGEFGTMLLDLFAPSTDAEFHLRRAGDIAGVEARVYDFVVERPRSHWKVQVASQSLMPGYKGSVWIEPASGKVMRLEMQARKLPEEFPLDTVESAVDYDRVMIGGQKFLLPVHAETLSCERGTSNCSRNAIDFRNYHKFEANSDITFK